MEPGLPESKRLGGDPSEGGGPRDASWWSWWADMPSWGHDEDGAGAGDMPRTARSVDPPSNSTFGE